MNPGPKHRGTERIIPDGYCSVHGKYAYTEEHANEVLKQVKGHQGKGGKVERRVYRCPWGDHYHLTSTEDQDAGADT